MSKLLFRPYSLKSESCKTLADALTARLGYKVWRITDDSDKPQPGDVVVNWGRARAGNWPMVNKPEAVTKAISKVRTFQALDVALVRHPRFTVSQAEAITWHGTVLAREDGEHGGKGIIVCEPGKAIPVSDFYSEYVAPKNEYRVHVFKDTIIDYVRKGRKDGDEPEDREVVVRNHGNGWIFLRGGVVLPDEVAWEARKAVAALGLDFGAVDVIEGGRDGFGYVLEVNTAPGMEGTTVEKYAEALASLGSE